MERAGRAAAGLGIEGLDLSAFYASHIVLSGRPLAQEVGAEGWQRLWRLCELWREAEELGIAGDEELVPPGLADLLAAVEESLLLALLAPGQEDDGMMIDASELADRADVLEAEGVWDG